MYSALFMSSQAMCSLTYVRLLLFAPNYAPTLFKLNPCSTRSSCITVHSI